ncbi:HAMP domain-containing sensor histidine kinase [Magnetovibrio sp. PR-2]|uniref:PAS domain-containing sensor histidine kinase n=1 Tax=Magnetovibrio sp. PR-2 TaxID=3120356 RepID=UPI002FCE56EF
MNFAAEQLHTAFDLMPAQVAVLDAEGVIRYTNDAWNEFANENGYDGSPFEGMNYLELCDCTEGIEAQQAQTFSVGLRSVMGGVRRMYELVYPCHSKTTKRWFKGIAYRYKGHVAVVHINITAEYQRLDRLSGLFDSAELIHDLRSPLNAIIGFSDLALTYNNDNIEKLHENLDIIKRSGMRMLDLVNDVLETARFEGSGPELVDITIDLTKLLADIIAENQSLAEQSNVTVNLSAQEGLCLSADDRSLWKIFANLITNAIKYNRDGGSVSVRLDMNRANGIVVEVEDTGIGISEADLEKVTDPFYRASHEDHTVEGTGLGLAIVRDMVNKHDAQLVVDSVLGKGSTFSVEFPSWRTMMG